MEKIKEILIGTNNDGKYREISDLLPKRFKKYSPKEFNILSPNESGSTYEENSKLKASFFSRKTNLVCISDDSGLEIELLNGAPGIYSSRWAGIENDFDLAIKKVFSEMNKVSQNWENNNNARFVCSLTLHYPSGKSFSSEGSIKGKISKKKIGNKGFGYDPIFIPNGFIKTFGELSPDIKKNIDHRFNAFAKIKNFFTN
jgi:XTP/dITP diphosphohydrolase